MNRPTVNYETIVRDRFATPGCVLTLAANFLLHLVFYLVLPVLPFYLTEAFRTGNAAVGVTLSCHTVASLRIHPFSGYLLDTLARKPFYLIVYFVLITVFAGYILVGVLLLFIMFRVVYGLAFGTVTVTGNIIVIDTIPSSRREEAVSYCGLVNNTAMNFGPMIGLSMHNTCSFETIFLCSLLSGIAGFTAACLMKTSVKQPVRWEPISLDRFVLIKGIPTGVALLLLSIPHGMTSIYTAMYAKEIGIILSSGLFLTFMAIGMAVSRTFSGRQVDKGHITQAIILGFYLVRIRFLTFPACDKLMQINPRLTDVLFSMVALLLGVGFGTMSPAFNALFVSLAPNNQRGTAISTYLTSRDVGIGIGLVLGSYIAQFVSFDMAYLLGACLIAIPTLYFNLKVAPHYHKNKLR